MEGGAGGAVWRPGRGVTMTNESNHDSFGSLLMFDISWEIVNLSLFELYLSDNHNEYLGISS